MHMYMYLHVTRAERQHKNKFNAHNMRKILPHARPVSLGSPKHPSGSRIFKFIICMGPYIVKGVHKQVYDFFFEQN